MLTLAKEIVSNLAKYFNNGESTKDAFWRDAAFGGQKLFQRPLSISKMQRKQIDMIVMFYRALSVL